MFHFRRTKPHAKQYRDKPAASGALMPDASLRPIGIAFVAFAAFLAGAAVMIVELTASRVLAPHFGNTLFTWTAVIGVILLALSLGYYVGGALADRRPNPTFLLHFVAAAGLSILLIPTLTRCVTGAMSPEGRDVDLIWGPVIATFLLFAVPAFLLGAVAPFSVKLLSMQTQDQHVGASAGMVSMLFTVGSVVGTFAAGFALIPLLGSKALFLTVGSSLSLAAAIGYSGILGMRSAPAAVVVVVAAALAMVAQVGDVPRDSEIVWETDSRYHRIQIMRAVAPDGRGVTFLLTDGAAQGAQADSGERLVYAYNRYVRLEQLFCEQIDSAAFLGGGAYAMPQALSDDHPDAHIDVVEIDPEVEELGRRWFGLDDYQGRLHPVTSDARRFLAANEVEYDLIFGDVFRGRQVVPHHLVTREFLQLVSRRLHEDGVYMMNLVGAIEGPRSRLFCCVAATLREVFPELYVFTPYPGVPRSELQNLVLVAPKGPRGLTMADLVALARDDELATMVRTLVDPALVCDSTATVLTDDFTPVEYLAAVQMR